MRAATSMGLMAREEGVVQQVEQLEKRSDVRNYVGADLVKLTNAGAGANARSSASIITAVDCRIDTSSPQAVPKASRAQPVDDSADD